MVRRIDIRMIALCGVVAAGLAGCLHSVSSSATSGARARCEALEHKTLPADAFGLPTGGASVSEAVLVPADEAASMPEYCRVRGAIAAAQPSDPSILFQVNLPTAWNKKTVQYGGAGLNGVLVQATGNFVGGGGKGAPPALTHGYVTYGSDSGHQGADPAFYANPQAFLNYSHEAVKRSFDAMRALVASYYGEAPQRNYHIGGSKGGQEALQAAQRYFADFDGVVSYYPAAQSQSLQLGWTRMWHHAFEIPGGALNTAEQALLRGAVMAACDSLDGATDGIVSDVAGCRKAFKVETLRCRAGRDAGDTCLSDRQIAALNDAAARFTFAHPMPNGVRTAGPWPVFNGGDIELWFGTGVNGSQQAFFHPPAGRPEAIRSNGIDEATWATKVLATAQIFDASNPDLDGFRAKGGRMIVIQGTTDMLVPFPMTDDYFAVLRERYGTALRDFARYYVVPGYGHGRGAFLSQWDALQALDTWVETGAAPRDPVVTDGNQGSGRTRPLCEYPTWPKYSGSGSTGDAKNFACVTD